MKSTNRSLFAASALVAASFSVFLQAQTKKQADSKPDYTYSGEPNAKDVTSTVEATLYYDKDFMTECLKLKVEGSPFDNSTVWANGFVPKDLAFKANQKYRVTLVSDDRLHPTMLFGKYGTTIPTISRIETLDHKLIYDASLCPKHHKKAHRLRLPITWLFSDRAPAAVRIRDFPYGSVSCPTLKASWAPDTRETVLEFVCDECVKARMEYENNQDSEQDMAGQPAFSP